MTRPVPDRVPVVSAIDVRVQANERIRVIDHEIVSVERQHRLEVTEEPFICCLAKTALSHMTRCLTPRTPVGVFFDGTVRTILGTSRLTYRAFRAVDIDDDTTPRCTSQDAIESTACAR